MKDTYNFESKAEARLRLRNFVAQVYPETSRRKNLKVLTLLGHEPYELEQVWDPLEVPRQNITVVEALPGAYQKIRNRNLGVHLIDPCTLEEYVRQTQTTYDCFNIDETSSFGLPQRDTLRNIAGRGLLGKEGLVATWYLAKREAHYTKTWFEHMFGAHAHSAGETEGTVKGRSNIISRFICAIFLDGLTNVAPHPLANHPQFKSQYVQTLVQDPRVVEYCKSLIPEQTASVLLQQGYFHATSTGAGFIRQEIQNILKAHKAVARSGEAPNDFIPEVLYYQDILPYYSYLQERYKYISDRGAPMLVDFNHFKQRDWPALPRLDYGLPWKISIKGPPKDTKKFDIDLARDTFRTYRTRTHQNKMVDRIFLGSSAQGSSRRKKIKKEEVINLLRQGVSIEGILARYPGQFKKMQLAAYRAHLTMNTYDPIAQ